MSKYIQQIAMLHMKNKMTHFQVSLIKSISRIVGLIILTQNLIIGASILIFAELLGILEEYGTN